MKESAIEAAFVRYGARQGWYTRKFSSPAHRGVPDRLVVFRGRVVFIEFKQPGEKPTRMQEHELRLITNQGIYAFWSDDAEEAVILCSTYFNGL